MPVPHVTKRQQSHVARNCVAGQTRYIPTSRKCSASTNCTSITLKILFSKLLPMGHGSSRKGRIISPQSSFFMLNVMMGTHISLSMPNFPKVTSIIAEVDKGSGEQPEDIGKSEAPLNFHFWVNLICLHDIMKFVRNSGDK